jgi:hypothetical protein
MCNLSCYFTLVSYRTYMYEQEQGANPSSAHITTSKLCTDFLTDNEQTFVQLHSLFTNASSHIHDSVESLCRQHASR